MSPIFSDTAKNGDRLAGWSLPFKKNVANNSDNMVIYKTKFSIFGTMF